MPSRSKQDFSRLQSPDARPADVLRFSIEVAEDGDRRHILFVDQLTRSRKSLLVMDAAATAHLARAQLLAEAFARFANTGGTWHQARLLAEWCEGNLFGDATPHGLSYVGADALGAFDHRFEVEGADPPAYVRVVEGADGFVEYLTGIDLERHESHRGLMLPHHDEED